MSDKPVIGGRILAVDDQADMCWILSRIFSERGHEVRTAQTGASALAALDGFDCQVAVVDNRLPDTDGLSLIETLKSRFPKLQAILMTSYGSPALEEKVVAANLFAYFNKPFNNDLMIETVEDALRSAAQGNDSSSRGTGSPTRFPSRAKSQ